MDITMIGLQNAGKTSLLRVLAVSKQLRALSCADIDYREESLLLSMLAIVVFRRLSNNISSIPTVGFNMKKVQKGHVTLKWYGLLFRGSAELT